MSIIELNKVAKFFGNRSILKELDYKFSRKQKYVISGDSGIGKTTLLNLIAGYIQPDAGTMSIVPDIKIEYLFQDDMLFSNLTVKENLFIKYCVLGNSQSFTELASAVLIKLNIDYLLTEKIATLSGGERQRVQLASILLSQPDVVLMDEPISKLDKHNQEKILSLIDEVFKDTCLIIVSHQSCNFYSSTIKLVIRDGKLEDEK